MSTQVFRTGSIGSVIFRMKRWFYARYYTPCKQYGKGEIAERNKEIWTKMMSLVAERIKNIAEEGSDVALKITLEHEDNIVGYAVGKNSEPVSILEFNPRKIKIVVYKRVQEFEIPLSQEVKASVEGS